MFFLVLKNMYLILKYKKVHIPLFFFNYKLYCISCKDDDLIAILIIRISLRKMFTHKQGSLSKKTQPLID